MLLFAACGPAPVPSGSGFIALERDFLGYEAWEAERFEGMNVDGAHTAGARVVFLKERPAAGLTEWPVGTMLVKDLSFTTFAMVKRGGGYNQNGAVGWEWFELTRDSSGTPRIKWRGLGPPLGENYSKSGQTCNACHGASTENDSVLSTTFRLSP